jgi:hypothetical protein
MWFLQGLQYMMMIDDNKDIDEDAIDSDDDDTKLLISSQDDWSGICSDTKGFDTHSLLYWMTANFTLGIGFAPLTKSRITGTSSYAIYINL